LAVLSFCDFFFRINKWALFAVLQMYNLFWIGGMNSGGSPGLAAHKLTLLYNPLPGSARVPQVEVSGSMKKIVRGYKNGDEKFNAG